jgi:hypothetical protein
MYISSLVEAKRNGICNPVLFAAATLADSFLKSMPPKAQYSQNFQKIGRLLSQISFFVSSSTSSRHWVCAAWIIMCTKTYIGLPRGFDHCSRRWSQNGRNYGKCHHVVREPDQKIILRDGSQLRAHMSDDLTNILIASDKTPRRQGNGIDKNPYCCNFRD